MLKIPNYIYFQFKSEKQKYKIPCETTELCIGDIKKEIIKMRNMAKYPEKFELVFFNEDGSPIQRDDNFKVEPHSTLLVKRIPFFFLNSGFREVIYDPKDIENESKNENFLAIEKDSALAALNSLYPHRINLQTIHKFFSCKHCYKHNLPGSIEAKKSSLFLLKCCYETICEKCLDEMGVINSNNVKTILKCKICHKTNVGFTSNSKVKDFRDLLISYLQALPQLTSMTNGNQIVNGGLKDKNDMGNFVNSINTDSSYLYLTEKILDKGRFFIIKSSNLENISTSQIHNEWATTVSNQKKINDAFLSKEYIILIFSANKSRSFQGFAIMNSTISDKIASYWTNDNGVNLGGTFSVQWLCTCELSFGKVNSLTNPISGEPVIKSRGIYIYLDTQELSKDIGMQLCKLCYDKENEEISCQPKKKHFQYDNIPKLLEDIRIHKINYTQKNNPYGSIVGYSGQQGMMDGLYSLNETQRRQYMEYMMQYYQNYDYSRKRERSRDKDFSKSGSRSRSKSKI